MRIAVLAWGSLVWQPRNAYGELAVAPGSSWEPDGPALPIEFARISSDGRLTLIVVPGQDVRVPVLWRRSARGDLTSAIANLAERETRAPADRIHAVGETGVMHGDVDDAVAAAVHAWLDERPLDTAIWTGLPEGRRWREFGHDGFSPEAALAYAAGLSGPARDRTAEYVRRAPAQITTPLRPRLEAVFEHR